MLAVPASMLHRARRMLAAKQPLTESLKGNRAARDARYGWRQRGRSGPGCDRPGGWCLRAFGETRSLLRAVERGRPPVRDKCWRSSFAGAAGTAGRHLVLAAF